MSSTGQYDSATGLDRPFLKQTVYKLYKIAKRQTLQWTNTYRLFHGDKQARVYKSQRHICSFTVVFEVVGIVY